MNESNLDHLMKAWQSLGLPQLGWITQPSPLYFKTLYLTESKQNLIGDPQPQRLPLEMLIKEDGQIGRQIEEALGSSLIYGGNKLRKLEYILPLALSNQAQGVATIGAEGSHHVLATITAAHKLGLKSYIAFTSQEHSRHSLAIHKASLSLATEVTTLATHPPNAFNEKVEQWRQQLIQREETIHFIPTGGSSLVGTYGMIFGLFELIQQLQEAHHLPSLDAIYITTASGSSLVGLLIGLALAWPSERPLPQIYAVKAGPKRLVSRKKITKLYQTTVQALLNRKQIEHSELCNTLHQRLHLASQQLPSFKILGDYLGHGYAAQTYKNQKALAWAKKQQLILDPSYTSKTFAALIDQEFGRYQLSRLRLYDRPQMTVLHPPNPQKVRTVLFWNTLDPYLPSFS